MKLKLNACPKCRGDLELRRDVYGVFVSCIQCGLQKDLDAPNQAVELAESQQSASIATVGSTRKELLKAA